MKEASKMKTVILAEKPSQAREYANAMQRQQTKTGYIEGTDPLFDGEMCITYGFGHLVDLLMPEDYDPIYKKWSLDHLPVFPDPMRYQVAKEKQKQFGIVKRLLTSADQIVIATDSDREGELIAWLILHQAGIKLHDKPIKRLWINSLEKSAIREGFRQLRDAKETYSKFLEAQTRQKSDWLVGMNFSPLYTLQLGAYGIRGTFPIGRVQTPTFMMVYLREKEIEAFKPVPFYEFLLNGEKKDIPFQAKLKEAQTFPNREAAASFLRDQQINEGDQQATVYSVVKEEKQMASPKLFSLSSLQVAASKRFKASPKQTLQAVQTLYEKKWLTYPRTDSTYITDKEFAYLSQHLNDYQVLWNITTPLEQKSERKRYVNNSKVQEHHAIIPTRTIPTKDAIQTLSLLEQQIYELVSKNTMAMFASDFCFEETTVQFALKELLFQTKGRVTLENGWKYLIQDKEEASEKQVLPAFEEKEIIEVDLKLSANETKALKPYTEGTLIQAMKLAGKQLDDEFSQKILKEVEGIGTEATRADVLEKLKAQGYLSLDKQKLRITDKGQQLGQVLEGDKLLSSAEMTATWEKDLHAIGNGELDPDVFLKRIRHFVKKYIKDVPESFLELTKREEWQEKRKKIEQETMIGVCPICGKAMQDKGTFYGCTGYRDDPSCRFSISKKIGGKTLTNKQLMDLLTQGKTNSIKNFTSKAGKKFDAALQIKDGKVTFLFQ